MKGIGIDIVSVKSISESVADKILSSKELVEYNSYMESNKKRALEFLAGRLACKEAYFKAMGISSYDGILYTDISVYKDKNGVPKFKGVKNAFLTLSHDNGLAVAVVVIE